MTNFDKVITFASEDEDGDLRVGMSMMSNKIEDNLMDFAEFQKLANENEDLKHKMR